MKLSLLLLLIFVLFAVLIHVVDSKKKSKSIKSSGGENSDVDESSSSSSSSKKKKKKTKGSKKSDKKKKNKKDTDDEGKEVKVEKAAPVMEPPPVVIASTADDSSSKATAKKLVSLPPAPIRFCAAKQCGEMEGSTEIEKWECLGRLMFSPPPGRAADEYYVEHDCGGVGWGNSIRALFNAGALSALTGRRLIVTHAAFNRMFLPPDHLHRVSSWDFGLGKSTFGGGRHDGDKLRQYWDFENHGRAPDRFALWAKSVKKNPTNTTYTKPILVAGVCGGEREILVTGGCMKLVS